MKAFFIAVACLIFLFAVALYILESLRQAKRRRAMHDRDVPRWHDRPEDDVV